MMNRNLLVGLVLALVVAAFAFGRMKGGVTPPAPGRSVAEPLTATREARASDAAVPAGGCRVGFVDLQTVHASCRQNKEFEAEMIKFVKEGREKLAPQIEPLEKEFNRLKEQYQMLAPGAPERADLEAKIRHSQEESMRLSEPWERDLQRKQLKERERIYRLIQEVTARIAKARGFEMVVADIEEPHANFSSESSHDLKNALDDYAFKIQRKTVLYVSRDVDLTTAVLEAVNAEP